MTSATDEEAMARIRVTIPIARYPSTDDPSDVANLLILADLSEAYEDTAHAVRRVVVHNNNNNTQATKSPRPQLKRKRDTNNAEQEGLLKVLPKRFRIVNHEIVNIQSPVKPGPSTRFRRVCTNKEGNLVIVVEDDGL